MWRTALTPPVKGRLSRKWLVAIGIALWVMFYLGRVYGHHGTGAMCRTLELLGMTWMGMLFLCTITFIAADLITGFGFLFPRRAPAIRSIALIVGLILSGTALVQGTRAPVLERYKVELPGLPAELDNTVLVAMSDLHLGNQINEKRLKRCIDIIQSEKPNILIFLGDIFEGHGFLGKKIISILGEMNAPFGKWAVLGNHESHGGRETGIGIYQKAGFRVLRDEWAEVVPGLVFAGVDDRRDGRGKKKNQAFVVRALSGRPKGATVFLSHRPVYAETAAKKGANLMLSSHTHAGQVWPFGYLVRLRYPLLSGRYEVTGMTVITSRGAGTWGPKMRLWLPGDILHITLKSKKTAPGKNK